MNITKRDKKIFLFWVVGGSLWAYAFSALAVNVTTVVLPNGGECLTVGETYTISFSYSGADIEHVALYYRTDGAQPTHLDSSVIKHPINLPQQGTTYDWKPTSSHISETGRIWIDSHDSGHPSLSTWDSSNANFSVRSNCAVTEVAGSTTATRPKVQMPERPAGFESPAKAVNVIPSPFSGRIRFESPWTTGEYRVRLIEERGFQLVNLAEKNILVNPGDIIEFPEFNLHPNTFYQNKKYIYAYDFVSSYESVRSEVMQPFWTLPENPKQLEVRNITATSAVLTLLDEVPNLGVGRTGVLFEEVNSAYSSDWISTKTWNVMGLKSDIQYQFWAKLRSGDGNETPSRALVTFRTKALPSPPPTLLPTPSPAEIQTGRLRELKETVEKIAKVVSGYQELADFRKKEIKEEVEEIIVVSLPPPLKPTKTVEVLEKKIVAEIPPKELLRSPKKFIVTFDGKSFHPAFLEILEGDIVEWRNESSRLVWPAVNPHPTHTGLLGFDAQGFLLTGEFYRFTFRRPGTWPYHDHRSTEKGEEVATGSVVVLPQPILEAPVIVKEEIPLPTPPVVMKKVKKPIKVLPPVLPVLSEELKKIEKEALAPIAPSILPSLPLPSLSPLPSPPRSPKTFVVLFDEGKFKPQVLEINSGDTVRWINQTDRPVWPASDPHPTHTGFLGFDALGDLSRNEVYKYTFSNTGSWPYHNHTVARVGDAPEAGVIIVKH